MAWRLAFSFANVILFYPRHDMFPIRFQYRPVAFCVASFLVCVVIAGCQEQATTHSEKQRLGPKESFQRIVESLRRDIEKPYISTSSGLGIRSDEIMTFTHSSKLEDKLFPPDEEHETYTASITVKTSVTYAAARPPRPRKHNEKKQDGKAPFVVGDGSGAVDPLALLDPLTDTARSDTTARKPDLSDDDEPGKPIVRSTKDTSEEVIKMVYKDERWETASEIETEWLRNEVERALRHQ